jgi:hypothetical protein
MDPGFVHGRLCYTDIRDRVCVCVLEIRVDNWWVDEMTEGVIGMLIPLWINVGNEGKQ